MYKDTKEALLGCSPKQSEVGPSTLQLEGGQSQANINDSDDEYSNQSDEDGQQVEGPNEDISQASMYRVKKEFDAINFENVDNQMITEDADKC